MGNSSYRRAAVVSMLAVGLICQFGCKKEEADPATTASTKDKLNDTKPDTGNANAQNKDSEKRAHPLDELPVFKEFMATYAEIYSEAISKKLAPEAHWTEEVVSVNLKKSDLLEFPIIYEVVLRSTITKAADSTVQFESYDTLQCARQNGKWRVLKDVSKLTQNHLSAIPLGVEREQDPWLHQKVFDVIQVAAVKLYRKAAEQSDADAKAALNKIVPP